MCLAAGEGERHPVRQPASLSTKKPKPTVTITPEELQELLDDLGSTDLILSESLGLKGRRYRPLKLRSKGLIDTI